LRCWWPLAMLLVASVGLTPTLLGAGKPGKKFGAEGCGHPVVLLRARTSDSLIDDLPPAVAPSPWFGKGVRDG
jgi:hypothetical protein